MDYNTIFQNYRSFLEKLLTAGEIEHVGGSSVPGAITKGDLDIQVRISKHEFTRTLEELGTRFDRNRLDLWNGQFALFTDQRSPLKVDIMVTVIGSTYDTFHIFRDILKENRELLEEYNHLKVFHPESSYDEYTENKKAFFGKILKQYLHISS